MGSYLRQHSLGLRFDAIYSGYLASEAQGKLLERAIELLKNDETLVIVDPAMADNGKYYANLGDWMAECFRRLIKKANIITPNITEACLLTGMEYRPGTHSIRAGAGFCCRDGCQRRAGEGRHSCAR